MSDPRLLLLFAVRLLLKAKFTLALLVLAVAFGVGFQIPNNANLAGYSRELLAQGMRRATGHVTLTSPTVEWDDVEATVSALEALPSVVHVTTRLVQAAVVLREGAPMPVRLVGVDLARERRATGLCARLARGNCIDQPGDEVLVGWEAAQIARLAPGQTIELAHRTTRRAQCATDHPNLVQTSLPRALDYRGYARSASGRRCRRSSRLELWSNRRNQGTASWQFDLSHDVSCRDSGWA